MNEELYCVHIQGVDDVIPTHTMSQAVRQAAYLNSEYLELYMSLPSDDRATPHCFAIPALWPHSAEDHAESLKNDPDFLGAQRIK